MHDSFTRAAFDRALRMLSAALLTAYLAPCAGMSQEAQDPAPAAPVITVQGTPGETA
jgi:hypothetical protein